tara:strand:- start:225 stop:614 length:390 start_codon:yes stop_codon:yes gene_type:complete
MGRQQTEQLSVTPTGNKSVASVRDVLLHPMVAFHATDSVQRDQRTSATLTLGDSRDRLGVRFVTETDLRHQRSASGNSRRDDTRPKMNFLDEFSEGPVCLVGVRTGYIVSAILVAVKVEDMVVYNMTRL